MRRAYITIELDVPVIDGAHAERIALQVRQYAEKHHGADPLESTTLVEMDSPRGEDQ